MNFEMIDLEDERMTEVISSKYELKKDHVLYQTEYYSEEKNQDLELWEDKYTNLIITITKACISGIELAESNNKWKVMIHSVNKNSTVWMFYKKHSDAKKSFDEIYNWLYNS